MSKIKTVHVADLGNTLEVTDSGYVEVKINDEGNVKLERTGSGVKASVELPEVKKAIASVTVEEGKLVFHYTDDTTSELALPATAIDVKLEHAELTEENKLKLTLSNGDTIETDLSKFVDAPKSAQEYLDEMVALTTFKPKLIEILSADTDFVEAIKDKIIDAIKGEEIQNAGGTTYGFLIKQ